MFNYLTAPTAAQAHLWLTYGWLGVCGLAPVVVVLIVWAICMHYTYRQKWRTLDLLLAATLLQEIPNALVVLIIAAIKGALIHLPRSAHTRSLIYYGLVWATASTRFYQFAVVTSLLADRALILKWPYRYRFAIRHTQIRVFLVLLAVVASLVGAGAIYAHYLQSQNVPFLAQDSFFRAGYLAPISLSNQTSLAPTVAANSSLAGDLSFAYRFAFDPVNLERHFNYLFVGIYVFFILSSVVCFLYVECNRPRSSSAPTKSRYLPSIATLFTTATTTSSTSTSSSTSSSLSASSPLPSRFSSLANLTAVPPVNNAGNGGSGAHSNPKLPAALGQALPSFYYGHIKRESKSELAAASAHHGASSTGPCRGSDTLSSLYPISIVDMMAGAGVVGPESGAIGSSAFASMSTTDNSIYRLLDANNGHSRSNSLNQVNETGKQPAEQHPSSERQHRSNGGPAYGQSDPASSLDPLHPTGSRVNSFSKPHLYSASSQIKLNTGGSADSFATHRSAFDLRWSSVLGPVTFCLAFNHGPYLIFTLLGIFIPGLWTPFHDLILASLTLFEALLLPFIFFLSDSAFRNSVKKSCRCGADKVSSKSGHASLAFSERKFASPPYLHSSKSATNGLGLPNYTSELDLSKPDPPSGGKLGKSHFLGRNEAHQLSKPSHAASMLDLSSRTPYHQQHQSTSRSRHSVALLQNLPTNSPTPRSSFRRRPPSVASYHYLYSSNQNSKHNAKYPQYLFGGTPSKSESTLSVPLAANYYTPPSMITGGGHLKEIEENELDAEPKMVSTISALGSNFHLNQRVPSITDLTSRPILSRQISEPATGNEQHQLAGSNGKSGGIGSPRLKQLLTGIASRSSFKKSSVRKCGSDASTFYTRRNLKRSQIAQNQLSSILYNNFYTKKLVPAFGSQTTLLENGDQKEHQQHPSTPPVHLPSRHLSYDFSQQSPMANSHVYLPSTSHLDGSNRSSSCNQLSVLNGDYHNHLLVKQNFALLMSANEAPTGMNSSYSPRGKGSMGNDYTKATAIAEDEHIYASLPEEEEDEAKQSGSFSARSTLPDNRQLIGFAKEAANYSPGVITAAKRDFERPLLSTFTGKSNGHLYGQRQGSTGSDPTPSPPSNENSHSPVDDEDSCDDTIYEEVSNLMDSPPSSGHEQMLADSRRRSASQDTLTGGDLGGPNGLQPMSDDDGDSVDEDGISILSEASSSTFSSFTTSANQDFEFIVSQKSTAVASRNFDHEARESTAKQSAKGKTGSSGADSKEPSANSANDSDVEPSTLSMAAMYYNRFILNESGPSKATGHRQRPKVNRRQSFSTAYELRQRILVNQLNRERFEDETGMELIEEEEMEPSIGIASNGETLEELLSYKLNRRISTSEDNLLSIISTIANCGDANGQDGSPSGERSPNKTPTPSSQSATSSSADSSPAKTGTFLKKDGPAPVVRKMLYTKKAPRARQQIPPQSPVTSHSSAIPRAAASSNPGTGNIASPSKASIPGTANISIRELKSKKQATRRTPDGTPSHVRPKSALNVNVDRICELGSLWNRTSTGPNSANSPKSTPTSKPGARYTATSKLLDAVTISTSSSSPSTPCRVPTFIPAPVAVRTPTRKDPAGGNFSSKLTPPSQYVVKVKQNARQNAILAKNALSADTDRDRCK